MKVRVWFFISDEKRRQFKVENKFSNFSTLNASFPELMLDGICSPTEPLESNETSI